MRKCEIIQAPADVAGNHERKRTMSQSKVSSSATLNDPMAQAFLPVDAITVQPQIRKVFDEGAMSELTESVRIHGVISPVLVREEKGVFTLIAGERRLRAAKAADLKTIPVRIMAKVAGDALDMQIIENVQREDLGLEETAAAVNALYERLGLMSRVCEALGKSMPWVSKMVGVAKNLSPAALELLAGNHTRDIELLGIVSRIEAMSNAFPRLDALVQGVVEKKAGRKEAKALYDNLQNELKQKAGANEETTTAEAGPSLPFVNFGALDAIHAQMQSIIQIAIAGVTELTTDKEKMDALAAGEKEVALLCKAYASHALNVLKSHCAAKPE